MTETPTTHPFELPASGEPGRVLRGVVDRPAGATDATPLVVILHGFKGFFRWGFFPELARRVVGAGHCALRFNFTGSGVGPDLESFSDDEGFEANAPTRMLADARHVLATLRAGGFEGATRGPIGLVGHSMGGAVALLTAADAAPVASVVTWAAVASFDRFTDEHKRLWRSEGFLPIPNARTGQVHRVGLRWLEEVESGDAAIDPLAAAARLDVPTLLLHGDADTSVPLGEAHALIERLSERTSTLEVVPGAGHTFGAKHPFAGSPPHLEAVLERTLSHLARSFASHDAN